MSSIGFVPLPSGAGELARRYGLGSGRRKNLGLILESLQRSGPRSRADLVAETGLNKAMVAAAVGDLVDWQLVAEHEVTHTGQTGRPSRPIAISGPWVHGFGIEIRGDRVVGLITDLSGAVLASAEMPFPTRRDVSKLDAEEIDGVLAHLVSGLIDETVSQQGMLAGICLSVPSQLQRQRDRNPADSFRWNVGEAVDKLHKLLSNKFGMSTEILVERSATAAALAQLQLGAVPAAANMILISGGVALNAGFLIGGSTVPGAPDLMGDVGHMVVDPGGARCMCGGRGCWETVVGLAAILRECAPDLAGDPRQPASLDLVERVVERALRGDLTTIEGLERVGYWLGIGVSSLVSVLNPDLIVLDGYFSSIEPWVMDELRATVTAHVTGPAQRELAIEASWLDDSASTYGASRVATGHVVGDPVTLVMASALE